MTVFEWDTEDVSALSGLPYEVAIYKMVRGRKLLCGSICFQHDVSPDEEVNGTTLEDLIGLLIERIARFVDVNPAAAGRENVKAVAYLAAAQAELAKRANRRREQGVYGTNQPHEVDDLPDQFDAGEKEKTDDTGTTL